MVITSPQNPRIKYVRRLLNSKRFRSQEKAFVIEGTRWLEEARQYPARIQFVLYSNNWLNAEAHLEMVNDIGDICFEVDTALMVDISQLESSEGVLAVLDMEAADLPEQPSLLLIADGVADPGNLGTMIRTAAAAADGLLLAPGCVDPYNPKVVRSSKGAHLRLPLAPLSWNEIADFTAGMEVWIAEAGDHVPYFEVDWTSPCAIIVGGEAAGPSRESSVRYGKKVAIPMKSQVESLNVAVAAAIILFEAARQRIKGGEAT